MAFFPAKSQTYCGDVALEEARRKYRSGNFDDVISIINRCLDGGFKQNERAEAYKILSLTYLALDSIQSSKDAAIELLYIDPTYEPNVFEDPQRFIKIIREIKEKEGSVLVTSVSKRAENVLESPATVIIVTNEEIKRRGYKDIVEVLTDLPGFDVIKSNGVSYSMVYQRGYRSILTDRTLLLIDGVEENDLVSDAINLSRQYPLQDIKRVEIVYGPASTMYGANSFVGVINIVTNRAIDGLEADKTTALSLKSFWGSWNSKNLEGEAKWRLSDVVISLSGRFFESDEQNLSHYKEWDMLSPSFEEMQKILNITGNDANGNLRANEYLKKNKLDSLFPNSNNYEITFNEKGEAKEIILTRDGYNKAFRLDSIIKNSKFNNNQFKFNNYTKDWLLRLKVQIKDWTFGIQSWRSDEGSAPWYNDNSFMFGENVSRWIYWNSFIYLNFDKALSDKLLFTNLMSYRLHIIDGNTNFFNYTGYSNGRLSFLELNQEKLPTWSPTYYFRASNQLRNEMRLNWFPSSEITLLTGIEFRSSLIQGDYLTYNSPNPEDSGLVRRQGYLGTDHFRSMDLGIFGQMSYNLLKPLILTFGARVDNNKIREGGGYGTVLNFRGAAIFKPVETFILKGIFSEAFKDASNLQKYGTITGTRELANPTLAPERVRNFEFGAYWIPNENLQLDLTIFYANYNNVIGTVRVQKPDGSFTQQFQPIGKQEISGIQANFKYRLGFISFWTNYSMIEPIDKTNHLRISDIANFILNSGLNFEINDWINFNLRGNYVGKRLTGKNTSGSNNPITEFPDFFILNSSLGLENIWQGIDLSFNLNNIFDVEYFYPGVREATGNFSSRIPGERINFQLIMSFKY
ncbi:MAG: TonB-dependent receptor [Candidatus Kapabacteria bacterium]|nr:TonB-dependent receptor [Candidatus Kapabacteria bacterium]